MKRGRRFGGVTIQPKTIRCQVFRLPPVARDDAARSLQEIVLCSLSCCCFTQDVTSSHLKAAYFFFFLETAHPASGCCLGGKRGRIKERRKEVPASSTRSELCLLPQNIHKFFQQVPNPLPNLPWRFLTQPPPAQSQPQLAICTNSPTCSEALPPSQTSGLEAVETIKQSPALPLHRVRPPPPPPHPIQTSSLVPYPGCLSIC